MAKQAKKKVDIIGPTPEQKRRGRFELEDIVDKGQKGAIIIGKAYRKEPYFEELARRVDGGIDGDALRALRFYRNACEASARSEVKSNLNRSPALGDGDGPSPAVVRAKQHVRLCEWGIGAVIHTLRAIAVDDKSYAQAAMDRWGSREQEWIEKGKFRKAIVPRSRNHPNIIRDEFMLALRRLLDNVRPMLRTGD